MMDYSRYYKEERGCYSVYFLNRTGLDIDQITQIFSQFGTVLSVNSAGNLYGLRFVRYKTLDEIFTCLEGMKNHKTIKLSVQNKKYLTEKAMKNDVKPHPDNGVMRTPSKSYNQSQMKMLPVNTSNTYCSSITEKHSLIKPLITEHNHQLPALISIDQFDTSSSQTSLSSSTPKRYTSPKQHTISASEIVVANIPSDCSIHYILHMFRKQNPISVSLMTSIPRTLLQYCHVYFKKPEQAKTIEEKFDKFSLSGHSLIVVRPSRLLEEIDSL